MHVVSAYTRGSMVPDVMGFTAALEDQALAVVDVGVDACWRKANNRCLAGVPWYVTNEPLLFDR